MAHRGLPDGWRVEGLVIGDERIVTHNPTNLQLQSADAIIVSYTDELGKDYRTIHGGALNWTQVGQLIESEVERSSPVR